MNIHPGVIDKEQVEQEAKRLGLDAIDFSKAYDLYKVGAKNKSSLGYPDEFKAARAAEIKIIGICEGSTTLVWILADEIISWFKTSPILSSSAKDGVISIETYNSTYELRPHADN